MKEDANETKMGAGNATFSVKPTTIPVTKAQSQAKGTADSAYLRAENEDDDGYDPYSDRRSEPPLFEADPWR